MSDYVHLEDCEIRGATDAALLVAYDGAEYWIPRSQISERGENLERGDRDVTVSITRWIAEQKEIEVD